MTKEELDKALAEAERYKQMFKTLWEDEWFAKTRAEERRLGRIEGFEAGRTLTDDGFAEAPEEVKPLLDSLLKISTENILGAMKYRTVDSYLASLDDGGESCE